MSERFGIVDSGERKQWDSGMVREPDDGKPLYALIPIPFLRRVAIHMTRGAIKYSRDNWRQANSEDELQRMQDSAWRHFIAWADGQEDEDHMAALVFNLFAYEETKEKLRSQQASPRSAVPG